jgi:nitrogenase delta subunit
MSEQVKQLVGYVQERCLWQFFSRTWDRQENIDGIMAAAEVLLAGEMPKRETPMEKLFYADAQEMVKDFRERFPWIASITPPEAKDLIAGLKAELIDITITRSLNHELSHSLY